MHFGAGVVRLGEWSVNEAVAECHDIIQEAIIGYDPLAIYALFSGGTDSSAMLDVSQRYIKGVLFVDTTCGIEATKDFVITECGRREIPLFIERPSKDYWTIVRERGFFGPKDHPYAYRLLKKDAIRRFKKRMHPGETIMFFTGMRSSESQRRMAHGAKDRLEEGIWWVNPIRHWSQAEKEEYLEREGIPINPVSKVLGKSGECNCGCFAVGPVDKEVIRGLDPHLAGLIDETERVLEAEGSPYSKWGPGGGNRKQSCVCFGQESLEVSV